MATDFLATGRLPNRTGNDHPIGSPYGLFRTADGEIAIAPAGEAMYRRLLRALDAEALDARPEFATNALRAENRAAINAEIEARTIRETSEHWISVLNDAGVPCSQVMNLEQVFADPQVVDQRSVVTVEHPGHGAVSMLGSPLHIDGAPLPVRAPAPGWANTMRRCWANWDCPPARSIGCGSAVWCELSGPAPGPTLQAIANASARRVWPMATMVATGVACLHQARRIPWISVISPCPRIRPSAA